MTWARITVDSFRCAPEGHTVMIYPRGAEVSGKVAGWALAAGEAKKISGPTEASPKPYSKKTSISQWRVGLCKCRSDAREGAEDPKGIKQKPLCCFSRCNASGSLCEANK